MKKLISSKTAVAVAVLALLCGCAEAASSEGESQPGLSAVDGVLLLNGQPHCGMGVNYFSLFYRNLRDNSDLSHQEGLKALSDAGIPFVRFMACGFWPVDWELYLSDKERYFTQLDAVVVCAERNKIGLIPSLFWNMATVPDIVGEPIDQLGDPNSKTLAFIRQYTAEIVTRYKDSPAIWGWEFGNEYNLHVDLPNADKHRPAVWPKLKTAESRSVRDELTAQMMLTAYSEFAKTVRQYDHHRVIITGNAIPRPHAWHNSKERSWKADTLEQLAEMLKRDNPDPFNVMSVHIYPSENNEYPGGLHSIADLITCVQKIALDAQKPLFIGEFGAPLTLGADKERERFDEIVAAIKVSQVPLSAVWVFDHAGQDKDWNITFNNQRAYMLKAVSDANLHMQNFTLILRK